jgi:tRNA threonylcarbamoyladenosine biosynthesis protein TsaB
MLLALDTSSRMVGIALYDGVHVLCEYLWMSQDYHTVELAPAVADMLAKCAIEPAQLSGLAVALGPGSFTGLRIGLALAQLPMAAIVRAGRGRLAVGRYRLEKNRWKSSTPVQVLTAEELSQQIEEPTLVCGELDQEEIPVLKRKRRNVILASPAYSIRRPSFLAELAWQRLRLGKYDEAATLAPIYLHYNTPIPEP